MKKSSKIESDPRARAEAMLAKAPPSRSSLSTEALLHELQVHQIELEMQNEALRQAQIALEESRDRYADLYEFAPVGYLTLTRQGLIEQINLTGAMLLAKARQHLKGRRFAQFILDDDLDPWHRHFLDAVKHDQDMTCELRLRRGDDAIFHARLSCRRQATATNVRLRVTLTDITEQHQAEEALRIAAIAFESQEGMLVTDPAGVIVRVNRAFTQLTGYSAPEAVGRTPALLKSDRQDAAFYQRMWATLKEKHYWQGEIWNRHKDGKLFAEWLTISAVLAPDGVVTHYVGAFSEITKNKEAEAEIHRLAFYDPLTELPNRRLLYDRLGQAMAASGRNEQYGALLFLDLDNFKNLNDSRGHDIGDLLLIETARRLRANVREGDTVARLGGDEFVVMIEGLGTEPHEIAVQARQVGEKILLALASPYDLGGFEYHSGSSLGIALFRGHETGVDELLKHADLAMYQAKNAGRDTLRFFDPAMQTALDARSALEAKLRLALKLGQLHLHYQPQVDSDHRIIGAEALLRWSHPELGQVLPADFIPLAEDTGLILPIGFWVLTNACAQLKTWQDIPAMRVLRIKVSVSARQFRQPGFVDEVRRVLADTGADPKLLKIELTESLVLDDVDDAIAKVQALGSLGIGFSLDDFGTGYSSLSYLKRLPLEQLKVDRSFVRDLTSNPNDVAIVNTIITMGRTLGLDVIAEGVETDAQLAILNRFGCAAYQGFLFSRPLPPREFEGLVARAGG